MIRMTILGLMVLAAIAVAGLGIASYWRGIPHDGLWVACKSFEPRWQASIIRGTMHVMHTEAIRTPRSDHKERRLGPFYTKEAIFGATRAVGAGGPIWSLCALLMVCPCIALIRGPLRRHRRRRRNLCIACGYSLQGLAEPRCPECGFPFMPRDESTLTSAAG